MLTFLRPVLKRSISRQSVSRLYHENIIDHYENPRNVGSLDKKKKTVGTGLVGAPACGDVMKLQFEVDEDGKIVDAKFKTFGCGSAIASSSVATEWLKGKMVDDCLSIKVRIIIPQNSFILAKKYNFCDHVVVI
jgi:NifU-like protein involved in Fe-S cluster formation